MKMARMLVSGLLGASLLVQIGAHAQATTTTPTREERMKKQEGNMIFPFMKVGYMSGVIPVEGITAKPDPSKEVKLVFDFSQATSKGNQATRINEGLEEVVRTLNLHVASGTQKEKLRATIVFHAGSIPSIMSEDFYREQYQAGNPNIALLQQLKDAGVELLVCGQSLALREIPHNRILPLLSIALSAKTVLSSYAGRGYYQFNIGAE